MTKIILATGLADSGMDSVIDMVLEGSKKSLSGTRHIRFKDSFGGVERKATEALKKGYNVVIEGPLTKATSDGYQPLVPAKFFSSYQPAMIFLFEVPGGDRDTDYLQQQINRSSASFHATLGGSLLKVISLGKGGVREAIHECRGSLLSLIGK
jgi:hypothetical protein